MENITPSSLIRVSINKLVHSPLNVRKKQSTGIAELAALIFSQGLIHNLANIAHPTKNVKLVIFTPLLEQVELG